MVILIKNKDIVWKDFHIIRFIYLLILFILNPISIYLIIKDYLMGDYRLDAILLLIFCTYFLNSILRTKLTQVSKKGIRIGNAIDDKYEKLKLKKSILIDWKNIKAIKIIGHEIRRQSGFDVKNFLSIKTKEGKTYESFIANYKGFIKIMKKLNKAHLFSKDSKYQELINSKK